MHEFSWYIGMFVLLMSCHMKEYLMLLHVAV